MTMLPIKPALCAGFLLLGNLFTVAPVFAQSYVDVEAERRAAAEAAAAEAAAVQAAKVAAQAAEEETSSSAPVASRAGIQPYSGSTTVAPPPVEAAAAPITGTDSGSLMLRVQQLEADARRLNGLLEETTRRCGCGDRARAPRRSGPSPGIESCCEGRRKSRQVLPPLPCHRKPPWWSGGRCTRGGRGRYRAAYELVRERKLDDAVAVFTAFLADFPFGRYAPNAHYWLGELYLVLDLPIPNWHDRVSSCCSISTPDPKVPDALYKPGLAQLIKVTASARRSIWTR